jgi:hypothetical protein
VDPSADETDTFLTDYYEHVADDDLRNFHQLLGQFNRIGNRG